MLAIGGYDPVAYFPAYGGKPTPGDPNLSAAYDGQTYHFVNAEHRELFVADPEAYAPAYGGWCAFAMADGREVKVDPKSYEINDGRLFLFYHSLFTDTLGPWQKNRDELRPKADQHWAEIMKKEADA